VSVKMLKKEQICPGHGRVKFLIQIQVLNLTNEIAFKTI